MDTLTDIALCIGPVLMWRAGESIVGECGTCGTVFIGGRDDRHADTPNVMADDR